ncbi:trehalose-phosphatase [Qipengyuania sp.]|uniref:trehalose-phosphatase n=1 Tax=Qipengyuania sp. TaxID=2004515 RepID=UPI003735F9F0
MLDPTPLPPPPPPALREIIAAGPAALFLDFDGTLVEIASTPDAIVVPEGLAANLVRLSARLEGRLAIVSGRDLTDLAQHLGELPIACAGSHGASRRGADGTALDATALPLDSTVIAEVEAFARSSGARFERKAHGAALHSRTAPELEGCSRVFMQGLAARHGLAFKQGKFVAELARPGADKGAAVHAFMATPPFAGARPVFIGDDVTDDDGFAAVREHGGIAIAVGERPAPLAQFALADPAAVSDWLRA